MAVMACAHPVGLCLVRLGITFASVGLRTKHWGLAHGHDIQEWSLQTLPRSAFVIIAHVFLLPVVCGVLSRAQDQSDSDNIAPTLGFVAGILRWRRHATSWLLLCAGESALEFADCETLGAFVTVGLLRA